MVSPSVTVIVPTYNRSALLQTCLEALEVQTYPQHYLEVIVIDDGSTDETPALLAQVRKLNIRVVTQQNQGQVAALNEGARLGRGEIFVFLDDDVIVPPNFVARMVQVHQLHERSIVLPVVQPACAGPENRFTRAIIQDRVSQIAKGLIRPGNFTDLVGCCFTVKKDHFRVIGPMQTLPGKLWPDWNDVDFAYRAMVRGFEFWICCDVIVRHFESTITSLEAACRRAFNAGCSSTRLFQRHPDLVRHLPMFNDKTPLVWQQDPLILILRKLARLVVSSLPVMWMMESAVPMLERCAPDKTLRLLYRWIISGYIYRGYREGLQKVRREVSV